MEQALSAVNDTLGVSIRHDVYPTVAPEVHYTRKTFRNRVVLITGGSRGIGLETAVHYARAGAALALVGTQLDALNSSRHLILQAVQRAQVLVLAADVRSPSEAEKAVRATVARFGRLDILVANAGHARAMDGPFGSKDPSGWWDVIEVNLRGVYNFVHFSLPELKKCNGQIVITTCSVANAPVAGMSEYGISKLALCRLAEQIALEYPTLKVFALHPGTIETALNWELRAPVSPLDSVALPAAVTLYLTSGNADYLSGKFVSANWDLGELRKGWKEAIAEQDCLVSRLELPRDKRKGGLTRLWNSNG
ncbi:NAD-P-binding protein [Auriscalpium vulgare]|uniref:NAD-P-binding protein n=1 Tax=Auriscalpium vulgare TaxID=40419 RepID=A0ACB8RLK2_9AGAM|nr:NAD-P-binding protein [Auriscalpium vulgare]